MKNKTKHIRGRHIATIPTHELTAFVRDTLPTQDHLAILSEVRAELAKRPQPQARTYKELEETCNDARFSGGSREGWVVIKKTKEICYFWI